VEELRVFLILQRPNGSGGKRARRINFVGGDGEVLEKSSSFDVSAQSLREHGMT
jgi:hypothetical protein